MGRDTIQSDQGREAAKEPEQQADSMVFKTRIGIDLSELPEESRGYLAITIWNRYEENGSFDAGLEECWGARDSDSFDDGDADEIGEVAIYASFTIRKGGFTSGGGFMGARGTSPSPDATSQPDNSVQSSTEKGGS